jgi:hypothetical protein
MRNYKWIKDTEIARKLYDGRIIDSRLDHESEEFSIRVYEEVPDPDPEGGTVYVAPSSGIYTVDSQITIYDVDGWVNVYSEEDTGITSKERLEMTGTRDVEFTEE